MQKKKVALTSHNMVELTEKQKKILGKYADMGTESQSADPDVDRVARIRETIQPKAEKGLFDDTKQAVTNIKEDVGKRMDTMQAIQADEKSGKQGFFRSLAQKFGQGAGLASDVVGNVLMGGIKQATPEFIQEPVGEAVKGAVGAVAETEPVKKLVSWYSNLDPQKKRDLDAVLGTASLATDVIGGAFAKPAGKAVVKTAGQVVDKSLDIAKPVITPIKNTARGLKDVAGSTLESMAQVPARIATNVASGRAEKQAIRALPSKVAQRSVLNGVDINDAQKLISGTSKEQKPLVKKLVDTARDFEKGGKVDPIEIVGKPIVEKLNALKKSADKVGDRLGKIADDLGNVSSKETIQPVFSSLQRVKGLEGLKIGKKGRLDFSNTTLNATELASDRKAIQSIFSDAIKSGTGKQKHMLRQSLFETLGGKKKSLANITGTQENAYEAVRKGLSNVLDSKNPKYKILNKQYAKIARPITDMRKLMRSTGEADDIMNLKAGMLARRLTSNTVSRADVKATLRALDRAVAKNGTTLSNVENLQDMYNILDKYYKISGGTTLQSQTASAIGKSGGFADRVVQTVEGFAGQTEAVRRKAIDDLIDDLLK